MVEYSPHKNLGAQFDNLQEIWNWFYKIYGESVGITEDLFKESMMLQTMTGANEHAKLVDLYDRVTTLRNQLRRGSYKDQLLASFPMVLHCITLIPGVYIQQFIYRMAESKAECGHQLMSNGKIPAVHRLAK